MARKGPSYIGLSPASSRATAAARAASKKSGTRCELLLRRSVSRLGLRYRLTAHDLPGRPDLVFRKARVVVFCDGDFWHGRDLDARVTKLKKGHNAPYWVAKITANVARDRKQESELTAAGWHVLRYWESDIKLEHDRIARNIAHTVASRSP